MHKARFYSPVAKILPMGIFAIFVCWIVSPAWHNRWGALPTSRVTVATVPMLNAWIIAWNAEQLVKGFPDYWNAPIFHPDTKALAYNEPQPLTGIVAPVVWLTGSPNVAYVVYLFLSLFLNGYFAFRLLATLGVKFWLGIAGGMSVILHPLALQNIDVLQLVPLWGFLWIFECLYKLSRGARPAIGVQLGLAVTTAFWASVHQGFLFCVLLLFASPLLLKKQPRYASVLAIGIAVLIATLCVSPILYPIRLATRDAGFARSEDVVRALSATTDQWLRTARPEMPNGSEELPNELRGLNPGWLRISLVVLLFFFEAKRAPTALRRFRIFLAAIALSGFILSYGANLEILGWNIWNSLCAILPPLSGVRSVYRFAYFSQLALILLATVGLEEILRRGRIWTHRRRSVKQCRSRRSVKVLVFIVALAMMYDVPPPSLRMIATTDVRFPPDWVRFLHKHASPKDVVLCLPFFGGNTEQDFELTTLRMLQLSGSGLRLVNGYSGFFPITWHENQRNYANPNWSPMELQELRDSQVRYVIIDRRRINVPGLSNDSYDELPQHGPRLVKKFEGNRSVEVFELTAGSR